jgi:hypothetical protein
LQFNQLSLLLSKDHGTIPYQLLKLECTLGNPNTRLSGPSENRNLGNPDSSNLDLRVVRTILGQL